MISRFFHLASALSAVINGTTSANSALLGSMSSFQADSDQTLKDIEHWIILIGFWVTQIGGILIAFLSTIGSLLVVFYFIYSLARFRLRMLSPAAKLVRLCMILLSICDLILSILFIFSTSMDLIWNALEDYVNSPKLTELAQFISGIFMIAMYSAALSEAFSSLSLAVSVLLAALHMFKLHSLRSVWPPLLLFIGFSFGLPIIYFLIFVIIDFLPIPGGDIADFVFFWGTGAVIFLCSIALVGIYVTILILACRRKKPDRLSSNMEQQSLTKFSRYLYPFVLCASLMILNSLILPIQDSLDSHPISTLLSEFLLNIYNLIYPWQGMMNCIILLLNSHRSFFKSFTWLRRRRRTGEVGQLHTDNEDEDDDEETMTVEWATDTPYRAPFLGNHLAVSNSHIKSPSVSQEKYSMRLYPRTGTPGSSLSGSRNSNSIN